VTKEVTGPPERTKRFNIKKGGPEDYWERGLRDRPSKRLRTDKASPNDKGGSRGEGVYEKKEASIKRPKRKAGIESP